MIRVLANVWWHTENTINGYLLHAGTVVQPFFTHMHTFEWNNNTKQRFILTVEKGAGHVIFNQMIHNSSKYLLGMKTKPQTSEMAIYTSNHRTNPALAVKNTLQPGLKI